MIGWNDPSLAPVAKPDRGNRHRELIATRPERETLPCHCRILFGWRGDLLRRMPRSDGEKRVELKREPGRGRRDFEGRKARDD